MEKMNNGENSRKNVWIIGISIAVILGILIVVIGMAMGRSAQKGDEMDKQEQDEGSVENDTSVQDNIDEDEEQWAVTAMYIPFGESEHIFVGEQTGPFVATFPDEIYDIDGNKITKEQLEKGNIVKLYGNGIMLESYPGQYPGITRMEVVEEGQPSDADVYQEIVDEIYQEPDPAEPPTLNVEYTTHLAVATVMVNRGGYEWIYLDEDGLSNAVVADSTHVLNWEEDMLADIRIDEPLELTLNFSVKPQEVKVIRYDASLYGKAQDIPEGEEVAVEEEDGKWMLTGVTGGYVYDVTGIWENGRANYGFITLGQE